uniref:CWH43-like N-terminal domain-containing protein n=1 Tax=Acanthochromis polyacanthus TaxID=80966 RepID=A0A3Q1FYH7_9TELE
FQHQKLLPSFFGSCSLKQYWVCVGEGHAVCVVGRVPGGEINMLPHCVTKRLQAASVLMCRFFLSSSFPAVMLIGLLRYAHVIEKHQNCVLNTAGLSTGWICAAGLIMVGNFQVDFAKVLHYVGAGVAFPSSMLFVCLQSALTYRLAKTQDEYRMGHLRVGMALLALVALVLSGVFFCQESFALQHTSAIFEWVYCMLIMFFYGTFAFEFGGMSGDTLMVLSRGGGLQSFSTSNHKADSSSHLSC